ncbi:MAG: acyltransferase family protein [Gemmatimonadaceae bacterium]
MTASRSARIPSLDGLRAVSIALVLLDHASRRSGGDGGPYGIFAQGGLGVTVFFVISGFLITGLLLRELDATGRIALGRFYFRRTLRIFPACYVYLGAMLVAAMIGLVQLAAANLVSAATYTSNYCFGCSDSGRWYLGHTWSLSVEEQFYLLWPLLLGLAGRRRGGWIAIAWLIACPLLRLARFEATGVKEMLTRFELVSDSIATGCLLALHLPRLHSAAWYLRFRDGAPLGLVLAVFLVASLSVHPSVVPTALYLLVGPTVQNLLIAVVLDHLISRPSASTGRLLNHPVLIWIGGLSYSLYLWQQPIIVAPRLTLPVAIAMCFIAAWGSAVLIERPVLRLRERIERTRGRPAPIGPPVVDTPTS